MASRFVCDLCGAFSRNPALAGRLHVGCPNGAGVWLVDGSPARAQCNDCGELDQDSSFCGQLHRHTDAGTTCAGTWIAFQRLAPVPLSPAQGGAVKSVPTLPSEELPPFVRCAKCNEPHEDNIRSHKPYLCWKCFEHWEVRSAFKRRFGVSAAQARKDLGI